MGTLAGALGALSPHSLLRSYLAVVICIAALAIGAVLLTTATVDSRTRDAATMANAATAAAQIQAGLREPLMLLLANTYTFLLSNDALSSLPEGQRAHIMQVTATRFMEPALTFPLPDLSIPLPDRDAVTLQRRIDLLSSQIDELVVGVKGVDLTPVVEERERLRTSLEAYFNQDSVTHFAAVLASIVALSQELDSAEDHFSIGVTDSQAGVNEATFRARSVMVMALVFLTASMGVATFFVGRVISRAFRVSEQERQALRETTETLLYRNEQLNGLYAVFSEITDTLSMRYVISATLRETQRVMNASLVVLRLVQDGDLVVAGSLTADGKTIPDLPAVLLGDGPTGRVARRGRSLRIDEGRRPSSALCRCRTASTRRWNRGSSCR